MRLFAGFAIAAILSSCSASTAQPPGPVQWAPPAGTPDPVWIEGAIDESGKEFVGLGFPSPSDDYLATFVTECINANAYQSEDIEVLEDHIATLEQAIEDQRTALPGWAWAAIGGSVGAIAGSAAIIWSVSK